MRQIYKSNLIIQTDYTKNTNFLVFVK